MAEKRKREGEGKLVLGYWAIRGLGQPIRLLLEFAKMPYEDKLYHAVRKEDGSVDKSSWFDEKFKLGLDFPNLPYLIDGDLKFTQTNAILQHLAEKAGLNGKSTEERAKVGMLFGFSGDVRARYTRASYSPEFHAMKADLLDFLRGKLKELAAYLSSNPAATSDLRCLVGSSITYVDLLWYDLLDQFKKLDPTILDGDEMEVLRGFYSQIHREPTIAAYRASDRFIEQFNNTSATFK